MINANGDSLRNLTENAARDQNPCWSPDGEFIAFASDRSGNGQTDIYVMKSDDSDAQNPRRLTTHDSLDGWPNWSPDGSKIVFLSTRDGDYEVWMMDSDGGNQVQLTNDNEDEDYPAFSPLSNMIAYSKGDNPSQTLWIMDSSGLGVRSQITTGNSDRDVKAAWSLDGTKLAFWSYRDDPAGDIYIVDISTGIVERLTDEPGVDGDPAWF